MDRSLTSQPALPGIDIADLSTRGLLALALLVLVCVGCWCIRAQLR